MRILIAGGGAAGLATALALSRTPHQVQLHERSEATVGGGMAFILVPSVHGHLRTLGLGPVQGRYGHELRRFRMRDAQGRVHYEEELAEGTVGVLRRDLLREMMQRVDPRHMHVGKAVVGYERSPGGRIGAALLDDGTRVAADLFVAADGIRSRARSILFPDWPSPTAEMLELVGLSEDPGIRAWLGDDFDKFQQCGGGVALGMLPVGTRRVVWYLQFDRHRFPPPGTAPGELHRFVQGLVGDWVHPVPRLLDSDFSGVHLWRPVDADLPPVLHHGNLVLAGDAAHPLLPFSSQGVASAIADAVALGAALAPVASHDEVSAALQEYSRQRRAAVLPFVQQGRELSARFVRTQSVEQCLVPIAG